MKKILFAIATVAMLFATSCKDENKFNEPVAPKDPSDIPANSFYCEIDNNANPQNAPTVSNGKTTMAYLYGKHVMWQPGDAINVNGTDFINNSSENQAAYFENEDASPFQSEEYEAYYPASLYNNNNHSYELPAVVTIDPDRNASHLPMYAYSTDHWLTFHNLCAAMKINVPMACSRIVIKANTAICGNFTVVDKTTAPYAQIDETGCDSIVIYKKATTGSGNQNFAIGDTAFVAIPAGTYTFTIKLYEGNRLIHEKTAGSTLTCNRNKVYNITTETDFFCFEALQDDSKVKFHNNITGIVNNIEYIVKGQNTWQPYTDNTEITLEKVGDKVYFRSTTTSRKRICPIKAEGSGQLKVKGNIMYLLNINPSNSIPSFDGQFGAFEGVFTGFKTLIDASELELPAETLSENCYKSMFLNSGIINAPKLPAETLAVGCYQLMFDGCSSLRTAPVLPAAVLVENCYNTMFYYCQYVYHITMKATSGFDRTGAMTNFVNMAGVTQTPSDGKKVHCVSGQAESINQLLTNGWTAVEDAIE
ncbi:MAG: hypothetical protein MJ002_07355 [Paludibacteraceae bacterium]|nr:hypothetical protein [Paludibacteraceae bacterium]